MATLAQKHDSGGKMGMIVKRVSVPIGLEELMEGLSKEVLLRKPKDLYVFASEYFSRLVILREKSHKYKVHPGRTMQSVIQSNNSNIPPAKNISLTRPTKHLSRQLRVHTKNPVLPKPAAESIGRKDIISKSKERKTSSERKDAVKIVLSKTSTSRDSSVSSNKKSGASTGTSSLQSTPREKRQSSIARKAKHPVSASKVSEDKKKMPKTQNKIMIEKVKTALISPTVIGGTTLAAGTAAVSVHKDDIKDKSTTEILDSDVLANSTDISLITAKVHTSSLEHSSDKQVKEDNLVEAAPVPVEKSFNSKTSVTVKNDTDAKDINHGEEQRSLEENDRNKANHNLASTDKLADNADEITQVSSGQDVSEKLEEKCDDLNDLDKPINASQEQVIKTCDKESKKLEKDESKTLFNDATDSLGTLEDKAMCVNVESKPTIDLTSQAIGQLNVKENDIKLNKDNNENVQSQSLDDVSSKGLPFTNGDKDLKTTSNDHSEENQQTDHLSVMASNLNVDSQMSENNGKELKTANIEDKNQDIISKNISADEEKTLEGRPESESKDSKTVDDSSKLDEKLNPEIENYKQKIEEHEDLQNIGNNQSKEVNINITEKGVAEGIKSSSEDNSKSEAPITLDTTVPDNTLEIQNISKMDENSKEIKEIADGQTKSDEQHYCLPKLEKDKKQKEHNAELSTANSEVKENQILQSGVNDIKREEGNETKAVEVSPIQGVEDIKDNISVFHKNESHLKEEQLDEQQEETKNKLVQDAISDFKQDKSKEVSDHPTKESAEDNMVKIKMEELGNSDDRLTVSISENKTPGKRDNDRENIKVNDNIQPSESEENKRSPSIDANQGETHFFRKDEELVLKQDDETKIMSKNSDSKVTKNSQNLHNTDIQTPLPRESEKDTKSDVKQDIAPPALKLDRDSLLETKYTSAENENNNKAILVSEQGGLLTQDLSKSNLKAIQNNLSETTDVTKKIVNNQISELQPGLIDLMVKKFLDSFISGERYNIFKDIGSDLDNTAYSKVEPEKYTDKDDFYRTQVKGDKKSSKGDTENVVVKTSDIVPTEKIKHDSEKDSILTVTANGSKENHIKQDSTKQGNETKAVEVSPIQGGEDIKDYIVVFHKNESHLKEEKLDEQQEETKNKLVQDAISDFKQDKSREVSDHPTKESAEDNTVKIKMEELGDSDDLLTVSISENKTPGKRDNDGENIEVNDNIKPSGNVENKRSPSIDANQGETHFFRKDEELVPEQDDETKIMSKNSDSEVTKNSQNHHKTDIHTPLPKESEKDTKSDVKQDIEPPALKLDKDSLLETKYTSAGNENKNKAILASEQGGLLTQDLSKSNLKAIQNNLSETTDVTKKIVKNQISELQPGLIDLTVKRFLDSFISGERYNIFKDVSSDLDNTTDSKVEPEKYTDKDDFDRTQVKGDKKSSKGDTENVVVKTNDIVPTEKMKHDSEKDSILTVTANDSKENHIKQDSTKQSEDTSDDLQDISNEQGTTEAKMSDSIEKSDLHKTDEPYRHSPRSKRSIADDHDNLDNKDKTCLENIRDANNALKESGQVDNSDTKNITIDTKNITDVEKKGLDLVQRDTNNASLNEYSTIIKEKDSFNSDNMDSKSKIGTDILELANDQGTSDTILPITHTAEINKDNKQKDVATEDLVASKKENIGGHLTKEGENKSTTKDNKYSQDRSKEDSSNTDEKNKEKDNNIDLKMSPEKFGSNDEVTLKKNQEVLTEIQNGKLKNALLDKISNNEKLENVVNGKEKHASAGSKSGTDIEKRSDGSEHINMKEKNMEKSDLNKIKSNQNDLNVTNREEVKGDNRDNHEKSTKTPSLQHTENEETIKQSRFVKLDETGHSKEQQKIETSDISQIVSAVNIIQNIINSKISVQNPGVVDHSVSQYLNEFLENEQSNIFQHIEAANLSKSKSDSNEERNASNKSETTLLSKEKKKKRSSEFKINHNKTDKPFLNKKERSSSQTNVLSGEKKDIKDKKLRRVRSVGVIKSGENEHKSKIPTSARKSAGRRPLVRQLVTDSKDLEEKLGDKKDLVKVSQNFSVKNSKASRDHDAPRPNLKDLETKNEDLEKRENDNNLLLLEKQKPEFGSKGDITTKEDVLIAKTILKGIEGAEKHIELIEGKIKNSVSLAKNKPGADSENKSAGVERTEEKKLSNDGIDKSDKQIPTDTSSENKKVPILSKDESSLETDDILKSVQSVHEEVEEKNEDTLSKASRCQSPKDQKKALEDVGTEKVITADIPEEKHIELIKGNINSSGVSLAKNKPGADSENKFAGVEETEEQILSNNGIDESDKQIRTDTSSKNEKVPILSKDESSLETNDKIKSVQSVHEEIEEKKEDTLSKASRCESPKDQKKALEDVGIEEVITADIPEEKKPIVTSSSKAISSTSLDKQEDHSAGVKNLLSSMEKTSQQKREPTESYDIPNSTGEVVAANILTDTAKNDTDKKTLNNEKVEIPSDKRQDTIADVKKLPYLKNSEITESAKIKNRDAETPDLPPQDAKISTDNDTHKNIVSKTSEILPSGLLDTPQNLISEKKENEINKSINEEPAVAKNDATVNKISNDTVMTNNLEYLPSVSLYEQQNRNAYDKTTKSSGSVALSSDKQQDIHSDVTGVSTAVGEFISENLEQKEDLSGIVQKENVTTNMSARTEKDDTSGKILNEIVTERPSEPLSSISIDKKHDVIADDDITENYKNSEPSDKQQDKFEDSMNISAKDGEFSTERSKKKKRDVNKNSSEETATKKILPQTEKSDRDNEVLNTIATEPLPSVSSDKKELSLIADNDITTSETSTSASLDKHQDTTAGTADVAIKDRDFLTENSNKKEGNLNKNIKEKTSGTLASVSSGKQLDHNNSTEVNDISSENEKDITKRSESKESDEIKSGQKDTQKEKILQPEPRNAKNDTKEELKILNTIPSLSPKKKQDIATDRSVANGQSNQENSKKRNSEVNVVVEPDSVQQRSNSPDNKILDNLVMTKNFETPNSTSSDTPQSKIIGATDLSSITGETITQRGEIKENNKNMDERLKEDAKEILEEENAKNSTNNEIVKSSAPLPPKSSDNQHDTFVNDTDLSGEINGTKHSTRNTESHTLLETDETRKNEEDEELRRQQDMKQLEENDSNGDNSKQTLKDNLGNIGKNFKDIGKNMGDSLDKAVTMIQKTTDSNDKDDGSKGGEKQKEIVIQTNMTEEAKEKAAAIKIQSLWRSFVVRKIMKNSDVKSRRLKLDQEEAIIKIQAFVRGCLDRLKYEKIRNKNKITDSNEANKDKNKIKNEKLSLDDKVKDNVENINDNKECIDDNLDQKVLKDKGDNANVKFINPDIESRIKKEENYNLRETNNGNKKKIEGKENEIKEMQPEKTLSITKNTNKEGGNDDKPYIDGNVNNMIQGQEDHDDNNSKNFDIESRDKGKENYDLKESKRIPDENNVAESNTNVIKLNETTTLNGEYKQNNVNKKNIEAKKKEIKEMHPERNASITKHINKEGGNDYKQYIDGNVSNSMIKGQEDHEDTDSTNRNNESRDKEKENCGLKESKSIPDENYTLEPNTNNIHLEKTTEEEKHNKINKEKTEFQKLSSKDNLTNEAEFKQTEEKFFFGKNSNKQWDSDNEKCIADNVNKKIVKDQEDHGNNNVIESRYKEKESNHLKEIKSTPDVKNEINKEKNGPQLEPSTEKFKHEVEIVHTKEKSIIEQNSNKKGGSDDKQYIRDDVDEIVLKNQEDHSDNVSKNLDTESEKKKEENFNLKSAPFVNKPISNVINLGQTSISSKEGRQNETHTEFQREPSKEKLKNEVQSMKREEKLFSNKEGNNDSNMNEKVLKNQVDHDDDNSKNDFKVSKNIPGDEEKLEFQKQPSTEKLKNDVESTQTEEKLSIVEKGIKEVDNNIDDNVNEKDSKDQQDHNDDNSKNFDVESIIKKKESYELEGSRTTPDTNNILEPSSNNIKFKETITTSEIGEKNKINEEKTEFQKQPSKEQLKNEVESIQPERKLSVIENKNEEDRHDIQSNNADNNQFKENILLEKEEENENVKQKTLLQETKNENEKLTKEPLEQVAIETSNNNNDTKIEKIKTYGQKNIQIISDNENSIKNDLVAAEVVNQKREGANKSSEENIVRNTIHLKDKEGENNVPEKILKDMDREAERKALEEKQYSKPDFYRSDTVVEAEIVKRAASTLGHDSADESLDDHKSNADLEYVNDDRGMNEKDDNNNSQNKDETEIEKDVRSAVDEILNRNSKHVSPLETEVEKAVQNIIGNSIDNNNARPLSKGNNISEKESTDPKKTTYSDTIVDNHPDKKSDSVSQSIDIIKQPSNNSKENDTYIEEKIKISPTDETQKKLSSEKTVKITDVGKTADQSKLEAEKSLDESNQYEGLSTENKSNLAIAEPPKYLKNNKDPPKSEITSEDLSSIDSVDSVVTVIPKVGDDNDGIIKTKHVSSEQNLPTHDIIKDKESLEASSKHPIKKSVSTDPLDDHVELIDQVQNTLLDQISGKSVARANKFDIDQLRKELHEAASLYKGEEHDYSFVSHDDELLEYLNDFEPEDDNTYDSRIIRTPVRELTDIAEEADGREDDIETARHAALSESSAAQASKFCSTLVAPVSLKVIDNKPLKDHVEIIDPKKLQQGHNEIIINNHEIQINGAKNDGKNKIIDSNQKLLHTSELHDSVLIPLDNSSLQTSSSDDPGKLKHTSEFHDTVIVPLPSGSDINVKNEAKELLTEKEPKQSTRAESMDSGNQTAFQQSPAGAAIVTSRRSLQDAADVVKAQESLRDTSPTKSKSVESFTHQSPSQSPRFVNQDMESENNNNKRNNAIGNKAPAPGKNMEAEAATKIQAGFRGFQVRKQLKAKNAGATDKPNQEKLRRKGSGRKNIKDSDLVEKSAVKIQAGVRGFLVRRRQKKQLNSSASA